jgi:uncharacterized protein DUF6476
VRALKILVVVMGVMLVGGFAALVAVIAGRVAHRGTAAAPAALAPAAPVDLPAGARVESLGVGADRLAVAIVLPDGARQILIIDLSTGRALAAIPLGAAP